MTWKEGTFPVLLIVVLLYIVLGGIGFHFLESTTEDDTRNNLADQLIQFLGNNTCINKTTLVELLRVLLAAKQDGIDILAILDNSTSQTTNWDYHSSIFFATTVVSTIGYGNISPQTTGGRVLAVVMGLVGIPLFLVLLALIGARQSRLLDWMILDRIFHPEKKTEPEPETAAEQDLSGKFSENGNDAEKVVESETAKRKSGKLSRDHALFHVTRIVVSFVFCVAFFCLIPAVIFQAMEDWTYAESIYYAGITVMTIGFGDFVAGASTDVSYRGWYRLSVAGWIILGLASCAGFINTLQDAYFTLVKTARRKAAEKKLAAKLAAASEKKDSSTSSCRSNSEVAAVDGCSTTKCLPAIETDETASEIVSTVF